MRVEQLLFKDGAFCQRRGEELTGKGNSFVLGFGCKDVLQTSDIFDKVKKLYPSADIVLCSTAGEIYDDVVYDDTVSVLAMEFEKTNIKTATINIADLNDSFDAGAALFNKLNADDLCYMMVISDGGLVNGSELVRGLEYENMGKIPITGGLAGDGDKFNYTLVGCNSEPATGNVVAIGFYGNNLKIGHSSFGGWEIFGPEKMVTRSFSNRLYEIDNKSAIELYKQYLGKYSDELPGSAFLFPLFVGQQGSENSVVRTILSIDYENQCMIFAGDIPQGSYIRFMKANFDKIINAATEAAGRAIQTNTDEPAEAPKLALLISCLGRKIILGKRIDEEIEAVKDVLGAKTILSGFYSYGEISPMYEEFIKSNTNTSCNLHNQTITITTFDEV